MSVITSPPPIVTVRPWIDPVVDDDGHDPRSRYVEQFWLGVLGPTATWLIRRFAAGLDQRAGRLRPRPRRARPGRWASASRTGGRHRSARRCSGA